MSHYTQKLTQNVLKTCMYNLKPQKNLEENTGSNLFDISLENNF